KIDQHVGRLNGTTRSTTSEAPAGRVVIRSHARRDLHGTCAPPPRRIPFLDVVRDREVMLCRRCVAAAGDKHLRTVGVCGDRVRLVTGAVAGAPDLLAERGPSRSPVPRSLLISPIEYMGSPP